MFTRLVLTITTLLAPELLLAQDRPMYLRPTTVVASSSDELVIKQAEAALSPELFGGRATKPGELSNSVYIGNCTATVVGPNVILTAGHCRSSRSQASFTYGNTRFSGTCTRHPQYSQGRWMNNDFALCKFSPALALDTYGDLTPTTLKVGDALTMQGYGAGSNGRLNVGESVVYRVDTMDYTTRGRVTLGGGDSGGGLFARAEDLVNGPFFVVGVNSRGDNAGNSYFNRTDLERSQSFFKAYAEQNNVEICGVNKDCQKPAKECPAEAAAVSLAEVELGEAKEALKACQQSE